MRVRQALGTNPTALSQPQNARASKKTATENVEAGCADIDDILENRMDKLMPKSEAISPDFVRDYRNARIVVDNTGGGGTPPTPSPA